MTMIVIGLCKGAKVTAISGTGIRPHAFKNYVSLKQMPFLNKSQFF